MHVNLTPSSPLPGNLLSLTLFGLCSLVPCLEAGDPESAPAWSRGPDPELVGTAAIENWLARPFRYETEVNRHTLSYPEVCTWYGSLQVARLLGDESLTTRLAGRFAPFLSVDRHRIDMRRHVDYSVAGVVPLEIYLLTEGEPFKEMGLSFADRQWDQPREDGLSEECRLWIDDLYMLPVLQVQAYRATGNDVYLDRAARTVSHYLDQLQQDNGLFHHAPDSPFFWGRGNGWVAAGLAELLSELPRSHPDHARITAGFRSMMATLRKVQGESGMWRQLLDDPDSWEESSCTGMFTFAILTGINKDILEKKEYLPVAMRAWNALVAHLDEKANITSVCVGTDKAFQKVGEDLQVQREYYLARPVNTGDLHGQAALLWSAAALLRLEQVSGPRP